MRFILYLFVLLLLHLYISSSPLVSCCTAILVSRGASLSGAPMTTHNNDCTDCDIRLALIPAADYPDSSLCPVYPCRFTYPRFVGTGRGSTYSPERLLTEAPSTESPEFVPLSHIPQVPHTYSYIEGTYPIANEHSLIMGESTCAAKFVAYGKPWGHAIYDISALMRIAMERCKTARCAAQLMGDLATSGGYYGANDPPEVGSGLYEESGEAVTIADPNEAWVFHVMPDQTGRSAIWVAQRLPDGHFTVVANKFIIRSVNLNDKENFLGTPNMREIAVNAGFWSANRTDFDFALAFAPDAGIAPGWADRRTWRLFDWVAPSLGLQPDGPEEFPFSVPVDNKLSLHDVMSMNRDHFEGTEFDLAHSAAAGPFNNPTRYDRTRKAEYVGGYFERAISLHRTSYSFVGEARDHSGVVWFAHHAPHSSLFIPLLTSITELPPSFTRGTIFQLRRSDAWWAFAAVTNYAEKMYLFIQRDVSRRQHKLEREAQTEVKKLTEIAATQEPAMAREMLTNWTITNAEQQVAGWWQFFDYLLTKFRDGVVLQSFEPPVQAVPKFYPAWWLGRVGYYDRGPMPPYMPVMADPQLPPHPDAVDEFGVKIELMDRAAFTQAAEAIKPERHAALKVKHSEEKEIDANEQFERFLAQKTELHDMKPDVRPLVLPDLPEPAYVAPSAIPTVLFSLIMSALAFIAGTQWQKRQNAALTAYLPIRNSFE